MLYRYLSDSEREKHFGVIAALGQDIVTDGENFWVVKQQDAPAYDGNRDLLAFRLAQSFANVAEVRLLGSTDGTLFDRRASRKRALDPQRTFLVRLAESYDVTELPCQTAEQAVATELVYSVWIRRRDAHARNRVYVQGIPVFFDHQTAFFGERALADIRTFFATPARCGFGGAWRVQETETMITTATARQRNIDTHYVMNFDAFRRELKKVSATLLAMVQHTRWREIVADANIWGTTPDEIIRFLESNAVTLDRDLMIMENIFRQPPHTLPEPRGFPKTFSLLWHSFWQHVAPSPATLEPTDERQDK